MPPSTRSATGVDYAAWLLAAAALILILLLHLLPALLAGLLVFHLVGALTPWLARVMPNDRAKLIAVALLSALVVGILVMAALALGTVLRTEIGSVSGLFRKLADLMESVRTMLPAWLLETLPATADALQAVVTRWMREHTQEVQGFGTAFGRGTVKLFIGMIIGALITLYEARPAGSAGPLALALRERASRVAVAFRRVVFAQIWISSLNTAFTAIFLGAALPAFGVHLPLTKTLIAITFIAGLLPVIGNLISNTVISFVALSVSLYVAIAALVYLIVIHKLEYFLNARIVGSHINARAWEMLIAMLVMESAFGLPGLVAAPIYYAYLKNELAARHLI
jgi:predicted PurR-regulated permease PerM